MKKVSILVAALTLFFAISVLAVNAQKITVTANIVNNTVVCDVSVSKNPGFAGMSLFLNFDNTKLTPLSITSGTALEGKDIVSSLDLTKDIESLTYVSAVIVETSDIKNNGILFRVIFSIRNGASGNTDLSLSYDEGNIANSKLEDVDFELVKATVNLGTGGSTGGGSTGGGSTGGGSTGGGSTGGSSTGGGSTGGGSTGGSSTGGSSTGGGSTGGGSTGGGSTGGGSTGGGSTGGSTGGGIETPTQKPEKIFDDVVESDWFFSNVAYTYSKGLMKGTSDSPKLFSPQLFTNRAMFVTVLYRMEGEPACKTSNFIDIEKGSYYEKAVAWAAENGIVNGMSETEFAPINNITREQTAKIINNFVAYKKLKTPLTTTDIKTFSDYTKVSSWAAEALQACSNMNIIRGRTDNTIDPQGNTTRAEAAAILQRLVEFIEKSKK